MSFRTGRPTLKVYEPEWAVVVDSYALESESGCFRQLVGFRSQSCRDFDLCSGPITADGSTC